MSKVLVTFFSASGVTRNVAEKIARAVDGDLFEIEPVEPYTDADLNWMNKQSRSSVEMNNREFRPAVKNKVENLSEYDSVVIGFPVWWYTAPTIVNTFIEENDLEGKNIYIFVTSGGSGYEGGLKDLRNTYPNLNFVSGKRLRGNESDEEYIDWIK